MKFTVVTLFPSLINNFVAEGLLGQANTCGAVSVSTLNPREFTSDVHHTVDDKAFGGSDGMVMKVEPLLSAVQKLRAEGPCHVVLLSPTGQPWSQKLARQFAGKTENIVLVCGRYAGIDQRFSHYVDSEISLGDFVLNGGEVAACAMIESISRLVPGVLGNTASAAFDSFSTSGELECPQFTRPREIDGMSVPAVLTGGNHAKVEHFTRACGRVFTALRRPDLLTDGSLSRDIALMETLSDAELKACGIKRSELATLKDRYP